MININNATTQIGYTYCITEIVNDLKNNPIRYKGTITLPDNTIKNVYWNLNGKCLGIQNSDFDLVILTNYNN